MPRYIDADALKLRIDIHGTNKFGMLDEDIRQFVDNEPTADVAVVKRGRWINRSLNIVYPEWERYTCSVCGKHAYAYDFCPNCGADMRGGDTDA